MRCSHLSTYRMQSSPKLYVSLAPMEFVYRGENGGGETFMYIPRRYIHYSSCSHMRRSSKAAVEHPFVQADKSRRRVFAGAPELYVTCAKTSHSVQGGRIIAAFLCTVRCLVLSQIIEIGTKAVGKKMYGRN